MATCREWNREGATGSASRVGVGRSGRGEGCSDDDLQSYRQQSHAAPRAPAPQVRVDRAWCHGCAAPRGWCCVAVRHALRRSATTGSGSSRCGGCQRAATRCDVASSARHGTHACEYRTQAPACGVETKHRRDAPSERQCHRVVAGGGGDGRRRASGAATAEWASIGICIHVRISNCIHVRINRRNTTCTAACPSGRSGARCRAVAAACERPVRTTDARPLSASRDRRLEERPQGSSFQVSLRSFSPPRFTGESFFSHFFDSPLSTHTNGIASSTQLWSKNEWGFFASLVRCSGSKT
jgi:hypothetical protein